MTRGSARHDTRWSLLLIASILIPGGFLAFLSVRNIGSQKDLVEKRVSDEEERVAARLGPLPQAELQRSAKAFFDAADEASSDLHEIALTREVGAFVAQPFRLDGDGRFLWPRFVTADIPGDASPESERFLVSFSRGEEAEFAGKDLEAAARRYRAALKVADRDSQRAAAVNGLARVLAKNGRIEDACRQYQVLLERYGCIQDDSGISFGRYSVHQLIRLHGRDPEKLSSCLSAFLSRLESGDAPLTVQTEPLLEEVEEWLERSADAAPSNPVRAQIGLIRKRLAFVSRNTRLGDLLQPDHPGSPSVLPLGHFEAVVGREGGDSGLFVIRRGAPQGEIVGFQVNLAHLRTVLLEQANRIPTSPAMDVSILVGGGPHAAADVRVLVRDLSPLLPGWRVRIGPRDPDVISSYVTRQRWIYGTTLVLLISGMVLGVVLVQRDLSRERRLAQLRTDFVANVTHELKTPLSSIRMFAETLQMDRVRSESERRECLDIIVGETQRLSRLINTVLDFSKIDRGQKRYRMAEVNLSDVTESTLSTLRYALNEQGFSLQTDVEPGVWVEGDADALEQAILNLVDNAVKYSRENKSVRVELRTRDNSVFLGVSDRGIGIPEEDRSRIFEKFYRSHAGDGGDAGGAGLGLTVVRHIVEAHQGRIELKSKVGEGSSFIIVLPEMPNSARSEANENDDDPRD